MSLLFFSHTRQSCPEKKRAVHTLLRFGDDSLLGFRSQPLGQVCVCLAALRLLAVSMINIRWALRTARTLTRRYTTARSNILEVYLFDNDGWLVDPGC